MNLESGVGLTLAAVILVLAGCGDDTGAAADAAVGDAAAASPMDAGGESRERVPTSLFDAGEPPTGQAGGLLVPAECDGDEDCSGGQLCCGRYDQQSGGYTSISCQDTCLPEASEYKLCHPGESCPSAGRECRRSSVLPYDYYSICAPPSDAAPTMTSGGSAAGEVNCGAENCSKGSVCCVRAVFNYDTMSFAAQPSYCAAAGEECDCLKEIAVPDADGGSGDAGY